MLRKVALISFLSFSFLVNKSYIEMFIRDVRNSLLSGFMSTNNILSLGSINSGKTACELPNLQKQE